MQHRSSVMLLLILYLSGCTEVQEPTIVQVQKDVPHPQSIWVVRLRHSLLYCCIKDGIGPYHSKKRKNCGQLQSLVS